MDGMVKRKWWFGRRRVSLSCRERWMEGEGMSRGREGNGIVWFK